MTVEKVEKPVRASARGAATRSALLEAASYVFRTSGFDKAGVSEVVAQAGASVGSLYHHFTGKADLYLALYQEFQQRQQERTHQAVVDARTEGENDPRKLMTIAARAYLEGCIEERELTRIFYSGDSPPGFEALMRQQLREWTGRNAALFRKADEPVDEALLMIVTGSISLAATEVIERDPDEARKLADAVVERLSSLTPRKE